MPKPLSALTAIAALSTCAALVLAQEPATTGPQLAAVTPAEDENQAQPVEKHPVYASETSRASKPTPTPKPAAGPAQLPSAETAPTPTPKPQKRSWFSWLFGSHHKNEEPTPTPAPPLPTPPPHKGAHKGSAMSTPTPEHEGAPAVTQKTGKATPLAKRTEKSHPQKPEGQAEATPKPEAPAPTPKPEKVAPPVSEPTATPPGKKKKGKPTPPPSVSASNPPPDAPAADADAETKEKYRFDVAKSKALGDPEVAALKNKADEATTEDESKKALRAYNKALFEKIRRVDSSVSEYSERLEAAILKRLDE